MIMTNTPTTPKQRQEYALLLSIRFAALMALCRGIDINQCPRVEQRIEQLLNYLTLTTAPSQLFQAQFENHFGALGADFMLRVETQNMRITLMQISSSSKPETVMPV